MRRYRKTKHYQWDHNIAYIAGLIASDGCMINDYRHINLTSSEAVLLESFKEILNLSTPIKQKVNGFGNIGYFVQFSDVSLYDFLFDAGIKPAKSKTIKSVSVPDEYYPDFLRGYFDGDGSIYGFWDKRWPNSVMYYSRFCGASKDFLVWLHDQNIRLAFVKKSAIKTSPRALVLNYAKADSRKLFEFMYSDPFAPALKKKKDKFIAFLEVDPYPKGIVARVPKSVAGLA